MNKKTKSLLERIKKREWIDIEECQVGVELLTCCLCEEKIQPQPNGWRLGNRIFPLRNEGKRKNERCCDSCNLEIVIPYRMLGDGKEYKLMVLDKTEIEMIEVFKNN